MKNERVIIRTYSAGVHYGTLVHESGWNCSPYLNVNNLGIEFDVPRRVLIEDWVEPHEMLNKL